MTQGQGLKGNGFFVNWEGLVVGSLRGCSVDTVLEKACGAMPRDRLMFARGAGQEEGQERAFLSLVRKRRTALLCICEMRDSV